MQDYYSSGGTYIGEENAVISLMVAILRPEEISVEDAISIALGGMPNNESVDMNEVGSLRLQGYTWREIANIYHTDPNKLRNNYNYKKRKEKVNDNN